MLGLNSLLGPIEEKLLKPFVPEVFYHSSNM
jgi:hypothetical protein